MFPKRIFLKTILFLGMLCLVLAEAEASSLKQFQRKFSLGGGLSGAMVVVGYTADAKDIDNLLNTVVDEARRTYDQLNANNPAGEVYRINSNAGAEEAVKVSWQVMDAFKAAVSLSRWTKGVVDVVTVGGNYNSIEIDKENSTIKLRKDNMRVDFSPILDGYLADYMIKLIHLSRMQNALVKVGTVFRGIGHSIHGPWKIEIQENFASAVQHALKLAVMNTGIAAISATDLSRKPLIDYRSKRAVSPRCKGVVIVMNEGVLAQGIAHAVFVLGPQEGYDFLNKFGKARGLIVDSRGQFLKTKGM